MTDAYWEGVYIISEKLLTCGLKKDIKPIDLRYLDLMGYRLFSVMTIWMC